MDRRVMGETGRHHQRGRETDIGMGIVKTFTILLLLSILLIDPVP